MNEDDARGHKTSHSFYNEKPEWIERAVQEGVAALPANRPVYAGLYLPDLKGEDFDRAVQFAMTGGAKGVSLFGGLRTVRGSKPGTSERSLNRP